MHTTLTKVTPSQRLDMILGYLELNAKTFQQEIRHTNITNVRSNGFPIPLVKSIINRYPQFNAEWLLFGIGKMCHKQIPEPHGDSTITMYNQIAELFEGKSMQEKLQGSGISETQFSKLKRNRSKISTKVAHLVKNSIPQVNIEYLVMERGALLSKVVEPQEQIPTPSVPKCVEAKAPNYNDRKFLTKQSNTSCSLYHARTEFRGKPQLVFKVNDCNKGAVLFNDTTPQGVEEMIEKLTTLARGAIEFARYLALYQHEE